MSFGTSVLVHHYSELDICSYCSCAGVANEILTGTNGACSDTNASKVLQNFRAALEHSAITGECNCDELVYLIRSVCLFLKADVQANEGVNSLIKRVSSQCPNIGLPILDARLKAKKALGVGSRSANSTSWKHRRLTARSVHETATRACEHQRDLHSWFDEHRYSQPDAVLLPTSDEREQSTVEETWGNGFATMFCKLAGQLRNNMRQVCFVSGVCPGYSVAIGDVVHICFFRYYKRWTAAEFHIAGINSEMDFELAPTMPFKYVGCTDAHLVACLKCVLDCCSLHILQCTCGQVGAVLFT